MQDLGLFGLRLTIGGYLAVHGAQKLFGVAGGGGLAATSSGFAGLGLRPARPMAMLAGASELGGGLFTIAGLAHPLGPIALAGAMAAASSVHSAEGPLLANGGYELPLTNLAAATALALARPSSPSLDSLMGISLPRRIVQILAVGACALTAYSVANVSNHRRELALSSDTGSHPERVEVEPVEPATR